MVNITQIGNHLRYFSRRFLFQAILISIGIPLVLGVVVFTIVYSLAILGPWLSGKILIKDKFHSTIDFVFGIDPMHQFRDDIKNLIGKHANSGIGERRAPEIQTTIYEIHQKASDRAERGEFVIAIVTGILALIIGTLTETSVIGWLLGGYSVLMSLTIALHVVVLDILAYNRQDDLSPYRRERLILFEGWNRAILAKRSTQASVLMIGILYRFSPKGYELAKELLDKAMKEKMSRFEAMIFITVALGKIANRIVAEGR